MKTLAAQFGLLVTAAAAVAYAHPHNRARSGSPLLPPGHNNFSCRSEEHPNPLVLIHGLYANEYDDLNAVEWHLADHSFCTFGLTYGKSDAPVIGSSAIGGLAPINESHKEIADFIFGVQSKTGASKVDLLGHSEGGLQALYTPKFAPGVSEIVDKIVAVAPPTHGSNSSASPTETKSLAHKRTGDPTSASALFDDCAACQDVGIGGTAVERLNSNGPIKQPGNEIFILASKYDELVKPTTTAFVEEEGVTNVYIQDRCPDVKDGHLSLVFDDNVIKQIHKWLDPAFDLPACDAGSLPIKKS